MAQLPGEPVGLREQRPPQEPAALPGNVVPYMCDDPSADTCAAEIAAGEMFRFRAAGAMPPQRAVSERKVSWRSENRIINKIVLYCKIIQFFCSCAIP